MKQNRPLAVVTGARRGIGAAIATELAARGFDIAITDIDSAGAENTLADIAAHGACGRLFTFDLADTTQHADVIEQIVAWAGPIACLVNNAGIQVTQRTDLLELGEASFDGVLSVNLRGTFFLTQAVARHMLAVPCVHPRSVVTVSSANAEAASINRGEYCLSKAGLGMLTKLFAIRLAEASIGVFEVRPGIIRTPMTQGVAAMYEQRIADGLVPMKRWGLPDDVARAVAVLASGELTFSTGSVVQVDGALSVPHL